jgi:hypothetical protein
MGLRDGASVAVDLAEGTGVEPDVPVPSAEVFDVAYRKKALRHVVAGAPSPALLAGARSALG